MPRGTERTPFLVYTSASLQTALDKARVLALEEDEENRKQNKLVSDNLREQTPANER